MGAAIGSAMLNRSRGSASRSPKRAEAQGSQVPSRSSVHQLQRNIGNRGLHRLLGSRIQPKLTVNPPFDGSAALVSRKCDACSEHEDEDDGIG
jgi:hypothetical protein